MDPQERREYMRLIDKAKLWLMEIPETTFYSSFLGMLNIRITRDIPTAATDGLSIMYNPDFIKSLTREQLIGLTLHEVEHPINGHCDFDIYKGCDPGVLNIAQDHHINLKILARGFELPPTPGLPPPNSTGYADPKFKGMSSMEIYHELMKDPPPPSPEMRDVIALPDGMSKEEHKERVTGNIVKAVIMAEQANDAGSIPGELKQNLEEILSPRLPWNTILQQYLTAYNNEDYTMRRPNKRFMPDWYLPLLYGEGLGNLFMYCDVSGSMGRNDVSEIWSEYSYIIDTMKPVWTHIMTGDTRIILDKTYDQGDFIPEFEYGGGGGTYFEPIIERIKEQSPVFALLFTDGYFTMPDLTDVHTDLFWIIKGNPSFEAEKGVVIHFE